MEAFHVLLHYRCRNLVWLECLGMYTTDFPLEGLSVKMHRADSKGCRDQLLGNTTSVSLKNAIKDCLG